MTGKGSLARAYEFQLKQVFHFLSRTAPRAARVSDNRAVEGMMVLGPRQGLGPDTCSHSAQSGVGSCLPSNPRVDSFGIVMPIGEMEWGDVHDRLCP